MNRLNLFAKQKEESFDYMDETIFFDEVLSEITDKFKKCSQNSSDWHRCWELNDRENLPYSANYRVFVAQDKKGQTAIFRKKIKFERRE
ncbi:hypothetical protein KY333_03725 [Candidatus Woesearchaeota archaeon]|nr:hypothetical protein [Candidatus Woesearchaeota archaeon]